ncbi:MAG: aspartate aminotransferase [Herminiimonas sp.]|nr:aspartate aminotransferase [Herminiimonas sp.]MDB5852986.1 aspartate aminotransferase [Herminiimonas sp.]
MIHIAARLHRIKPSPSSMAGLRVRELRASGRDVLGLTTGEPDFDTPEHIKEAAIRAMRAGKTKYTDVGGTADLKAAIKEKFSRENGLDYQPGEIIACTGAKQAIFNALMCTVESGDEVIVPAPYWVSYPDIVLLAGGTPVFITCLPGNGFKLSAEQLESAITTRTRWLILNSPNNPSGAVYTGAEMKALTDVLLRHPHVNVLSDDVYEHLIFDGRKFVTPVQIEPALKERALTINGVSKAYAMTGWRLGYAGGPAALIKNMVKLQSQSTSSPSAISQEAAIAALRGPQDFIAQSRAIFQTRRDLVAGLLNEVPGVTCHKPEGAFYAFASCEGAIGKKTPSGAMIQNDADFVMHLLESQNVAVIHGEAYGTSPYFRISFADSEERLREGCRRIRLACEQLV